MSTNRFIHLSWREEGDYSEDHVRHQAQWVAEHPTIEPTEHQLACKDWADKNPLPITIVDPTGGLLGPLTKDDLEYLTRHFGDDETSKFPDVNILRRITRALKEANQ